MHPPLAFELFDQVDTLHVRTSCVFFDRYCKEIIDVLYGYVLLFLIEFVGTLTFLLFTIIMEVR